MIKQMFSRRWIGTLIFICIPIIYAVYRITNMQFLDNAMGNLLATILGVIFGVPIGLEINRSQQEAQSKKEEKQRNEEQEEILKANIESVYRELLENEDHLKRLEHALVQINKPSESAWEWLIAISDSFSSDAYYSLDRSVVDENHWRSLHLPLYLAYPKTMLGLKHRIREGKAAYLFYLKRRKRQKGINDELSFIRARSRETLERVIEAQKEVDTFRRQKGYIQ